MFSSRAYHPKAVPQTAVDFHQQNHKCSTGNSAPPESILPLGDDEGEDPSMFGTPADSDDDAPLAVASAHDGKEQGGDGVEGSKEEKILVPSQESPVARPAEEGNDKTPPPKRRKAPREVGEVADITAIPMEHLFTKEVGSVSKRCRAFYPCCSSRFVQFFVDGALVLHCVGICCRVVGLVPGLCWGMLLASVGDRCWTVMVGCR